MALSIDLLETKIFLDRLFKGEFVVLRLLLIIVQFPTAEV